MKRMIALLIAAALTLAMPLTALAAPDMALAAPDSALAAPDMALAAPDTALAAPDMALAAPDTTHAAPDTALAAPGASTTGTLKSGSVVAITGKGALQMALKDAGLSKSQVKKVQVEAEKGAIEVEFTHKKSRTEYSYTFSAATGQIVEKEVEYAYKHNASKAKIGKKAALKKTAKFAGVKQGILKHAKCTYKYKKGEGTYKVTFRNGGWKYEYELLAPTGKVIEWEMERSAK